MLRIAIVDDEKQVLMILKDLVKTCIKENTADYDIQAFLSGVEFINAKKEFDIAFLDIDMPEMNGLETARQIKVKNPACKIVMATGITEKYKEAIRINVFRYVTKPFDQLEIKEVIQAYYAQLVGMNTIEAFYERVLYKIPQREICYVQAYNGYCQIRTMQRIYRSEKSLSAFEESLDSRLFVRVNRQYLVNVLFVQDVRNSSLKIAEDKIHISRTHIQDLRMTVIRADEYR